MLVLFLLSFVDFFHAGLDLDFVTVVFDTNDWLRSAGPSLLKGTEVAGAQPATAAVTERSLLPW